MKRWGIFFLVFVGAMYLLSNSSVFAQRGGGVGGGGGRTFGVPGPSGGRESGFGTSRTPSSGQRIYGKSGIPGEEPGHGGREMSYPRQETSNVESKGSLSETATRKTTSDLLTQNTKLSSKLQTLLPAGANLQDAAEGFDHLGRFVAAVHVSHNLDIPFDQLKAKMMNGDSLGQAIYELRPNVNAKQEAIKANQQALEDMEKSVASNKPATAGKSSATAGK
ncbi:MAG: hypothetical protein A3G40_06190 [Deltaproteobacteria bacterium RIFCSPLOWO2_12_FULL_57_22]|nr:MAG: hypothetical protein A3G40_06190 [Deltaproteobacteria bacterium RIFCSPLOWO2_12_FULL_57_22]